MTGSIIVVKLGGTEGVDFSAICADAVQILERGQKLVLVHGGSAEANALGLAVGIPPKFITSPSGYSSRYTDRKTLEVFLMAVNGKVNTLLVEQLHRLGVNALGLSGLDGRLLQATRKDSIQSIENGKRKIIRDDYTGKIEQVNSDLLQMLLGAGYLPVIAPVAVSMQGEALNVDADRAAADVHDAPAAEVVLRPLLVGVGRDDEAHAGGVEELLVLLAERDEAVAPPPALPLVVLGPPAHVSPTSVSPSHQSRRCRPPLLRRRSLPFRRPVLCCR